MKYDKIEYISINIKKISNKYEGDTEGSADVFTDVSVILKTRDYEFLDIMN